MGEEKCKMKGEGRRRNKRRRVGDVCYFCFVLGQRGWAFGVY